MSTTTVSRSNTFSSCFSAGTTDLTYSHSPLISICFTNFFCPGVQLPKVSGQLLWMPGVSEQTVGDNFLSTTEWGDVVVARWRWHTCFFRLHQRSWTLTIGHCEPTTSWQWGRIVWCSSTLWIVFDGCALVQDPQVLPHGDQNQRGGEIDHELDEAFSVKRMQTERCTYSTHYWM